MTCARLLSDMFTGIDNATYDVGRLMWALGCIAYIGLSAYHCIVHGVFDAPSWGLGFGGVLAGGGAALKLKQGTEPSCPGFGKGEGQHD